MRARGQVEEPKEDHDDDVTTTGLAPAARGGTTDPVLAAEGTLVQPFPGSELFPAPSGPEPTVRLGPGAFVPPRPLGEDLEHTPLPSDPSPTVRQPPSGFSLLPEAYEPATAAQRFSGSVPRPSSATDLQDLPDAEFTSALEVQDLALHLTDPALPPPRAAAPARQLALTVSGRRPAPPSPPQAPPPRSQPVPAPVPASPALPTGTDLEQPFDPADPSAGALTLPMAPPRLRPAVAAPASPGARRVPRRQEEEQGQEQEFAPTPPSAPALPKVDPLRERRVRAIQGRLARFTSSLIPRAGRRPPVWRVVLLGVVAGLAVAAAAAYLFYFRGR